jgi:phage gp46-like protein
VSDLALTWADGAADMSVAENDLLADDGLETAVSLSLFTDARAEDGDVLPDDQQDRRGWWADDADDRFGSRLWLLARSKDTADVLAKAPQYAREALAWMVTDGVAESVNATASRFTLEGGASGLLLVPEIKRPGKDTVQFRYAYNWATQEAKAV